MSQLAPSTSGWRPTSGPRLRRPRTWPQGREQGMNGCSAVEPFTAERKDGSFGHGFPARTHRWYRCWRGGRALCAAPAAAQMPRLRRSPPKVPQTDEQAAVNVGWLDVPAVRDRNRPKREETNRVTNRSAHSAGSAPHASRHACCARPVAAVAGAMTLIRLLRKFGPSIVIDQCAYSRSR